MKFGRSKYHAKKVVVDGITFDSKKEADRYLVLKEAQENGDISGLELQKEYELIPKQIINGKVAERACKYIADFVYSKDGKIVVEDSKGMRTPEYIIKRKLMLFMHKIRIQEV